MVQGCLKAVEDRGVTRCYPATRLSHFGHITRIRVREVPEAQGGFTPASICMPRVSSLGLKALWGRQGLPDLKDLLGPQDLLDMKGLLDPKDPLDVKDLPDPKDPLDLQGLLDPKGLLDMKDLPDPKGLPDPKDLPDRRGLPDVHYHQACWQSLLAPTPLCITLANRRST